VRSGDLRTSGSRAAHPEMPVPLPSPTDLPPPLGGGDTHLCLHHGWPLRPQGLHRLEHVHHPLVAHPLQHDAERDEHARAPDPSAAQREQEVPSETCQPQRGSAERCKLMGRGDMLSGARRAHRNTASQRCLLSPMGPTDSALPLGQAAVAPCAAQGLFPGATDRYHQGTGLI